MYNLQPTPEHEDWLAAQFEDLTDSHVVITPSEWAETKRYLPSSVTSLAGPYSFEVAPYLREIVDCLSLDSPVREVIVQKGAQIGATVGILENAIGYCIEHVRSAPCMLVTADAELAKLRVESYITPMLQHSQLMHLIQSVDESSKRKSGKTEKRIEWVGGGSLIPFGAQNANKLRSVSIQYLLRDEIDGWPDVVGKDGDPLKLSADRCAAYEATRKILDLSTPLVEGTSKIVQRFQRGDQRYYMVRCLKCSFPQRLRWRRNDEDGVISGLTWEMDDGRIVEGSVRYLCENCQAEHFNADKVKLLSPEYGAEWMPTTRAMQRGIRSYHISALYSPVGMQSWDACAEKWVECWDDDRNRPRDVRKLQVFYNNVLGDPFALRGERVTPSAVSAHRRKWYFFGQVPNKLLSEFCGGPVLVLFCTVDVHGDHLAVAVVGFCRDRRQVLIDYERWYGDTENLEDPASWGKLRTLIEEKSYAADDGRDYGITATLIDSGYRADTVYQFCSAYESGVFPVKGIAISPKNQKDKEFTEFTTPMGARAYGITVDYYKDRLSTALRHGDWSGQGIQPPGHFNAPADASDKQLRELTVEVKMELRDKYDEQVGWAWHRPSGAANELWDLMVYANAGLDILAWDYCINERQLESVSWSEVWTQLLSDLGEAPKG